MRISAAYGLLPFTHGKTRDFRKIKHADSGENNKHVCSINETVGIHREHVVILRMHMGIQT